ncbi:MAG TPA: hypothetical protein VFV34_26455, partial [Blastocatellia bacterium]|nr:hypothetical protein [Blastocatellia bacterium]
IGACLLWPNDESQARLTIKDAIISVASHLTSLDRADRDGPQTRLAFNRLRYELVQMIGERDSTLALEFLRSTRQESPSTRTSPGQTARDQETWLELNLAGEIAQQDAKLATQIADEGLNRGMFTGVVGVVARMRRSDSKAASELATRIVTRLRSEDLSSNTESLNGAIALVRLVGGDSRQRNARGDRDAAVLLEQQSYRELIGAVASAAASLSPDRISTSAALFSALDQIMPDAEKLLPANQLAVIRQKRSRYEQSLDPRTRVWKSYENVMEQGTVGDLADAAAKAPPDISDELYSRAAAKALSENDVDRAAQIAARITDPQQRASRMKEIEQHSFSNNLQQGKLEDAAQYIPAGASVEERVAGLIHLANVASQKPQKAVARRYLEDALALVAVRAENQFHFSTQLQVAHCYSSIDLNRSFEIIEAAIDRLNELLDAAAMLDGFGGDFFKDGELKPYNGGTWEELLRLCCEELCAVALEDSDRALAAANKLRRPEAQTLATIRVARRVLSDRKDKNASQARK